MNRCLGLALLLLVPGCHAQGPPGTETPAAETPDTETPAAETPDAETPDTETADTETPDAETLDAKSRAWQRYRLPNQRFSAEYPGLPSPVGFGGQAAGSETLMFMEPNGKGTWVVHATAIVEDQRSLSAEQILDDFRDHRLVMEKKDGTRAPVLVDEPVKIGGVDGRKFVFHAHGNNLSYNRVFVFEDAIYQASVVADRELADDPDIQRFFDSIRFHSGATAELDGPYTSPDGRFEIALARMPLVHHPPPNRQRGAVAEARYRGVYNGLSYSIMYVKFAEAFPGAEKAIVSFGPQAAKMFGEELVRDLPFEIHGGVARDVVFKSRFGHTRTLMVLSGREQFKIDIQGSSSERLTSKEVDALFASFRLLEPESKEGDAANGRVLHDVRSEPNHAINPTGNGGRALK